MSLRALPELKAPQMRRDHKFKFDVPSDAAEQFAPEIRVSASDAPTIDIYEPIDADGYFGFTARRMSAALRSIGERPVVVNINSPGGDYFEGVAIYEMLRGHQAKVTVQIAGMAASIASVIAMAADEIRIARTSQIMIHNAWSVVIGNRHDLAAAAEWLAPFDAAIAGVYADRTAVDAARAAEMMDKETWIWGQNAVEMGFADALLNDDDVAEEELSAAVRDERRAQKAFQKAGMTRQEAKDLIRGLKRADGREDGMPGAAVDVMPGADDYKAATERLLAAMAG